ncbi:MAG: SBBP repeat-containing protein [bacterium]|nr:SBBP repeat-containing protein [bacterium]
MRLNPRKNVLPFMISLFLFLVFNLPLRAGLVTVWTQQMNKGLDDVIYDITLDGRGYVYVTGYVTTAGDQDFFTVKYNVTNGRTIWTQRFGYGAGYDIAYGIAADTSTNVYVAGEKDNGVDGDIFVLKYSMNGSLIWTQRASYGITEMAEDVDVDGTGVYTTGHKGRNGTNDFFTVKFSLATGAVIWTQNYHQPLDDQANEVRADQSGYLYVTGDSGTPANRDFFTIKYRASDGLTIWTQRSSMSGTSVPLGLALDGLDYVYVTGANDNGVNNDIISIKLDTDGNQVWTRRYDSGTEDEPREAWADAWGNLYVSGRIFNSTDWDFLTLKYDPDGNLMWTDRFDGRQGDDYSRGIVVDAEGSIYLAGRRDNGANWDYFTVKYIQPPFPSAPGSVSFRAPSLNSVVVSWKDQTVNESGFEIYRSSDGNSFTLLAVAAADSTNYTDSGLGGADKYWYRIRAVNSAGSTGYSSAEFDLFNSLYKDKNIPAGVYPNLISLDSGESFRIVPGEPDNAGIKIYNMNSQLVGDFPRRYYEKGGFQVWDGTVTGTGKKVGAGVYIVLIKGDKVSKKVKVIIQK